MFCVTCAREALGEVQLRAALASYEHQDYAVVAGTGSGSPFIIALLILVDNPFDGVTITVSP